MAFLHGLRLSLLIAIVCIYSVKAAHVSINCIPLRKCPELYNLVRNHRDAPHTISILRASHCGYHGSQPKVWCTQTNPICKTPNGKLGQCMDLNQCGLLQRLIRSDNNLADVQTYLKNAKCKDVRSEGKKQPICCPFDDEIQITTTEAVTSTEPVTDITQPTLNILPNPKNKECGVQLTSKIFGGRSTQMDEFPWTALVQYEWQSQLSTNCGGSLISNRYVVTAAHCVDNSAIKSVGNPVNVILGEYDTRNVTDCINNHGIISCTDSPLIIGIESIIVHPEWYTKPAATINHDIALLRLSTNVKFTDYIRPICLPTTTISLSNKQLFVSGWGETELESSSPIKLKAMLPLANMDDCTTKYKNDKKLTVGDGEICVGGEAGKDSCSGDSGGPLMYASKNSGESTWFLAGVVSFGPNQPCGIKNYPGLYTYLPKYVDWIYQTVQT